MLTILGIIIEQSLLHLPLVLGAYVSLSLLKIPDLCLEAAFVFGAICSAQVLLFCGGVQGPISFLLVLIASILGGCIVGLIASALTYYANFPHLLSSILVIGFFHGVNQLVLGGAHCSVSALPNLIGLLPVFSSFPELAMLALINAVIIGCAWALFHRQLGYSFAIYGNNPRFFSYYHIATGYVFTAGLLVAHGCAGFCGALMVQSNGMADITMGFGMVLLCITALLLGRICRFSAKPLSILVPIIGTVLYFTIQQSLLVLATRFALPFDTKYFTMVQSVIVALILIVQVRKRRARGQGSLDQLGV